MILVISFCSINTDYNTGASVTEVLVCKLDSLLSLSPSYGNGKECDCLILLLTHLYNFKVSIFFKNSTSKFNVGYTLCLNI